MPWLPTWFEGRNEGETGGIVRQSTGFGSLVLMSQPRREIERMDDYAERMKRIDRIVNRVAAVVLTGFTVFAVWLNWFHIT